MVDNANPSEESIGITVASLEPVRWMRMNASTCRRRTSSGSTSMLVKKTFKS
jgi:hypothetical protein